MFSRTICKLIRKVGSLGIEFLQIQFFAAVVCLVIPDMDLGWVPPWVGLSWVRYFRVYGGLGRVRK